MSFALWLVQSPPPANLSAKMRSPGPSQPKFLIFGTLSKFLAIQHNIFYRPPGFACQDVCQVNGKTPTDT